MEYQEDESEQKQVVDIENNVMVKLSMVWMQKKRMNQVHLLKY
jgi:hypothetical protein